MISKLLKKPLIFFQFYYNNIFLNKYDKILIGLVRKNKKIYFDNKLKIALEMPEDYFYVISNIFLINSFKNINYVEIDWIKINTQYQKRGKFTFIKYLNIYNRKWHKLYLSNGGTVKLDFDISLIQYFKYYFQAKVVFNSLKSKEDLINLTYNGDKIGELVYDTYLRYKPSPTVNINDKFLLRIIVSTLYIYNITYKYFLEEPAKIIFTSYTSYVHHGILTLIALKRKVTIISMGSYELLFNRVKSEFPFHIKDYRNYKTDFSNIDFLKQKELLSYSKKLLQKRFDGINDNATFYMKNNAYVESEIDLNLFENSNKPKVIIFAHDFYDSPHVRRWILFPDFYEWLIFTFESANTSNYDYFVKIHPNSNLETEEIVLNLINKNNNNIKLLPKNISTKSLLRNGFNYGITNHGTIAHELPYFGIPVVNSGDNPHISFSFSYTVKSKEEYFQIINNLSILDNLINIEDAKNEIYEFYCMHNLVSDSSYNITIDENQFINEQIRFIDTNLKLKNFITKISNIEYKKSIQCPFDKFTNMLNN